MKMGFMVSGLFWGVVVVLFGVSILLRAVFHIDLPFFRVLFGLIVIYWGVCLLTNHNGCSSGSVKTVFTESKVAANGSDREFAVIFGRNTVDLSGISVKDKTVRVKSATVFGETVLVIDPSVPARINISSAFASATAPNGNSVALGEMSYTTKDYKEGMNCLNIEADAVFGSLRIVNK